MGLYECAQWGDLHASEFIFWGPGVWIKLGRSCVAWLRSWLALAPPLFSFFRSCCSNEGWSQSNWELRQSWLNTVQLLGEVTSQMKAAQAALKPRQRSMQIRVMLFNLTDALQPGPVQQQTNANASNSTVILFIICITWYFLLPRVSPLTCGLLKMWGYILDNTEHTVWVFC